MPHWTPPQRHWFHHIKFSLSASQPAHRSRLKQHHPTQHFNCFHKPTTPLVLKIILGNVPRHEHPTFGLTAQSAFARAAWALLVYQWPGATAEPTRIVLSLPQASNFEILRCGLYCEVGGYFCLALLQVKRWCKYHSSVSQDRMNLSISTSCNESKIMNVSNAH